MKRILSILLATAIFLSAADLKGPWKETASGNLMILSATTADEFVVLASLPHVTSESCQVSSLMAEVHIIPADGGARISRQLAKARALCSTAPLLFTFPLGRGEYVLDFAVAEQSSGASHSVQP